MSPTPGTKGKEAVKSVGNGKPRTYVKQTDVPKYTLREALRVAEAISEQYAKRPTKPIDIALALELNPNGRTFEDLTGASIAYGLTEGGAQADKITLTDVGRRIMAPTAEGEDLAAKREAVMGPRIIRLFLAKYDGSPLPKDNIARNVLEEMGVAGGATERVLKLIVDNAKELGLLKELKHKSFVRLDAPVPVEPVVGPLDTLSPEDGEGDEGREETIVDEVTGGQTEDRQHAETRSRPGRSSSVTGRSGDRWRSSRRSSTSSRCRTGSRSTNRTSADRSRTRSRTSWRSATPPS